MSYEITGTIHHIGETETFGSNFKKRSFILHVPNDKNRDWDDYIPMCCIKDRVDLLDKYRVGETVICGIDIKGKLGKKDNTKAFADLQAWKIFKADQSHGSDRFSRPPAREERREPVRDYKLADRDSQGRRMPGEREEDEINF